MRTSAFAFATDLCDEGVNVVLDNVERLGRLDGVALAVAYHDGRDVFPHNPRRRVVLLESGAVFFRPEPTIWAGAELQPEVSELVDDRDPLADLVAAAEPRGLDAHAWAVFLHNDALARRVPACAQENMFGDRDPGCLCPANPAVREYVHSLVTELAGRGVTSIIAESLHFHPLEHGHAHERYLVEVGAFGRFLLGLCFCSHCRVVAEARDVDVEAIRALACSRLEALFASDSAVTDLHAEVSLTEAEAFGGGALGDYMRVREETVSALVSVAVAAAGDIPVRFLDASGAMKGYWTGNPTGASAASAAWRFGVDPGVIAQTGAQLVALAYASDPARVAFDLDDYAARAPMTGLSCVLRPTRPDCETDENILAKLRIARARGIETLHLYHYGLARLEDLVRVGRALEALATEPI